MSLLEVNDLRVVFKRRGKPDVRAVDELNLQIEQSQSIGLVGESGCGKSITSLAILGLLPTRGVEVSGQIMFDGQDLLQMSDKQRRDVRGKDIAMIFQDPMTSLNPVIRIGLQITEALQRHRDMTSGEARDEAERLLQRVGIPAARQRLSEYPYQLSGGMRQRVLIAIALACNPRLIIADEPTTALDVTIQAQILDLLHELVVENDVALMLITHDLGVVAGLCDHVNVMYAGRVVESAPCRELFRHPQHRYTVGLLDAMPRLDHPRGVPLSPIPGSAEDRIPWTDGCAFAPRCGFVTDACLGRPPALVDCPSQVDHRHRCVHPASQSSAVAASLGEVIAR